MLNIQKKYIYIIIVIVGLIFSYGCYNLFKYKYVLYKAKKVHQESTQKVSNLKTKEQKLEQQKEDLDKTPVDIPDQKKVINFLNELGK